MPSAASRVLVPRSERQRNKRASKQAGTQGSRHWAKMVGSSGAQYARTWQRVQLAPGCSRVEQVGLWVPRARIPAGPGSLQHNTSSCGRSPRPTKRIIDAPHAAMPACACLRRTRGASCPGALRLLRALNARWRPPSEPCARQVQARGLYVFHRVGETGNEINAQQQSRALNCWGEPLAQQTRPPRCLRSPGNGRRGVLGGGERCADEAPPSPVLQWSAPSGLQVVVRSAIPSRGPPNPPHPTATHT